MKMLIVSVIVVILVQLNTADQQQQLNTADQQQHDVHYIRVEEGKRIITMITELQNNYQKITEENQEIKQENQRQSMEIEILKKICHSTSIKDQVLSEKDNLFNTSVEDRLEALETDVQQLQVDMERVEGEIEDVEDDINDVIDEINDVEDEINDVEDTINFLRTDVQNIVTDINTIEDDINENTDEITELQTEVNNVDERVSTLELTFNQFDERLDNVETTVENQTAQTGASFAFFAGVTTNIGIEDGQIIRFNEVVINDGSNYNPVTGGYTAPQDGTYVFTVQKTGNDYYAYFYIMVDDTNYIFNDLFTPNSDPSPTSTSTITIQLIKDQIIRVKNDGSTIIYGTYSGAYQSFFTGYMLYASN